MKRSLVWLVALLPPLAGPRGMQSAQADDQAVREELQAWCAKIVASYEKKDQRAYMELLTPDFKLHTFDGKTRDRKAQEACTRGDMATTGEIRSVEWNIEKLTVKGREATVVGAETWKGNFIDPKGEYGPKGKSYDVVWVGTTGGDS